MRRLALVFAIAENGVIGKGGQLPWSFPEDRRHFEAVTRGHVVIMGRRTWEETGTPLEGRMNVVVTRSSLPREDIHVASSLASALAFAWARDDEPFVIGGVRLFEEALPQATRIYVTDIPGTYEGDTIFVFDRSSFRLTSRRASNDGLVFSVLER